MLGLCRGGGGEGRLGRPFGMGPADWLSEGPLAAAAAAGVALRASLLLPSMDESGRWHPDAFVEDRTPLPPWSPAPLYNRSGPAWSRGRYNSAYFLRDFGAAMLAPLPPRARLIVMGDLLTFTLRYLQRCEGVRPDVQVSVMPPRLMFSPAGLS